MTGGGAMSGGGAMTGTGGSSGGSSLPSVVRRDVSDLADRRPELVLGLHVLLIAHQPALTARLPANGRVLARRLVDALLDAGMMDDAEAADAIVRAAGAAGAADGLAPRTHAALVPLLLLVVRAARRGGWSGDIERAWRSHLIWLADRLVVGAGGELARVRGVRALDPDRDDLHGEGHDEDDEDDELRYGQLMVSMTRPGRRGPRN